MTATTSMMSPAPMGCILCCRWSSKLKDHYRYVEQPAAGADDDRPRQHDVAAAARVNIRVTRLQTSRASMQSHNPAYLGQQACRFKDDRHHQHDVAGVVASMAFESKYPPAECGHHRPLTLNSRLTAPITTAITSMMSPESSPFLGRSKRMASSGRLGSPATCSSSTLKQVLRSVLRVAVGACGRYGAAAAVT